MQRRIKPDYQTVVSHTVTLTCLAQWDGWQFLLQEISVKELSLYTCHEGKIGTPAHLESIIRRATFTWKKCTPHYLHT